MRHGVTRKRSTKILKHTGKLIRKNLDLFCWNYLTCNIKVIINPHKPYNILIKDILFSYGSYYTLLVRVLVWLSEEVTEICCKKIVLISMKKIFKKYLLKDFIFSKVTDCRHATWLKINFFTGIFSCMTGVTG